MPNEEAAVHPSDVSGAKWEPPAGEPQGRANIAAALGVSQKLESETPSAPVETGEEPKTDEGKKAPKPGENKLVDQYSEFIQRNAEEAYAIALFKAKNDEKYLDTLVASSDPMDQKMATKLLSRNDFGAKSVDEYKRTLRVKQAGDDPKDRRLAELEAKVDELTNGSKVKDWSQWKKENAVSGEAEVLADQVRMEYPSMSSADVMAFVRGKLGMTQNPTQKEQMGFVRGGLGAVPEEDLPNTDSPLARALLPKDIKKTTAFAKHLLGRTRR